MVKILFFLHEDPYRGFYIDRKYIQPNIKIFNPINYPEISLFDFLYTIEKSKEVHVINSSFRTLIDIMNINHNSLNYHKYIKRESIRSLESNQPLCRLVWKINDPE